MSYVPIGIDTGSHLQPVSHGCHSHNHIMEAILDLVQVPRQGCRYPQEIISIGLVEPSQGVRIALSKTLYPDILISHSLHTSIPR